MRASFLLISFLLLFSVPNPAFPQDSTAGLASFSGVVRTIDRKSLLLKLADDHVLKFDRSGKTRFFKDSTKVKASAVHAGDLVSIEAREGPDGALEAVNVRLEQDPAAKVAPPVSGRK